MRRILAFLACALLAGQAMAQNTDEEKTLYALGVKLSEMVSIFELTPAELNIVVNGLKDGIDKKAKPELAEFDKKIQALAQSRIAKKSKAYLDEAAKQPGAQKTESGLIYISLKDGNGAQPTATDKVKVHYQGTLTNGEIFDSSYQRGEPITFGLNQVIKCWTEGLQKMKVGGKAKLVCPSEIAYGDRGAPPKILPGSTLVFEVELLGIEK